MSLSSDKLNGHPNPNDPRPGKRGAVMRSVNGWPGARRAAAKKQEAGTPAEQKRRVELAAKNRERAVIRQRNLKLLEIYEIPEAVKVPGEGKLFSRWLKDKGDKKFRFDNLAQFCLHVMQNYGDDEKDQQWRDFLAAADPQESQEEENARATADALVAIDLQNTSVPALPTSALPAESFSVEADE